MKQVEQPGQGGAHPPPPWIHRGRPKTQCVVVNCSVITFNSMISVVLPLSFLCSPYHFPLAVSIVLSGGGGERREGGEGESGEGERGEGCQYFSVGHLQ